MKKLTNKEIAKICEEMNNKHTEGYYKFKATQTKNTIKIHWGYLKEISKKDYFTITKKSIDWMDIKENFIVVEDEQGYMINQDLESDIDIINTIKSTVYYMITRY